MPREESFYYAFQMNTCVEICMFQKWNYDFRNFTDLDNFFSSSWIPHEVWVKTSPKGLRSSIFVSLCEEVNIPQTSLVALM